MNGKKTAKQFIGFLSLAIAGLLFQNNLRAAGVVSVFTDTALRSAVAGGGLVTFASSGTIVLTNEILITNDTSIDASGHAVNLSGGGVTRLFSIQPGVSLILQNLTLTNGLARGATGSPAVDGGPGQGGVVYNNGGFLTAGGCFFLGSTALGGTGGPGTSVPPHNPGTGGTGQGGAIYNQNGQVVVSNSVFAGNQALGAQGAQTTGSQVAFGGNSAGGALYSTAGQVLLLNCVVSSNQSISGTGQRFGGSLIGSAAASGGAIELTGGKVSLNSCRLEKNVSRVPYVTSSVGGAIAERGGELSVVDSTFSENLVIGGPYLGISSPFGLPGGDAAGGALYLAGGAAGFTNSTFTKNQVVAGSSLEGNYPGAGSGGAIYTASNLTLLNCTLHANTATPGDNGGTGLQHGSFGGGLCAVGGNQNLTNVTIANNAAFPSVSGPNMNFGGGIYVTNATLQLLNTLLSANPGSNSFGTIIDLGHNLSSDTSCNFSGPGSLNNTDPILSPLGDFGGPTLTMALLSGSPAMNAADPVTFPPIDQRGRTRPFSGAPDIGAFESSAPYSILGTISGVTAQDPVIVTAGASTAPVVNYNYAIHGLDAGAYSIVPSGPSYLIIPLSQLATVGPDKIGVNFKAYKWNAFTFSDPTNGYLHLIYATSNSTVRILSSPDLLQWSPVSTNTVGLQHYLELLDPIGIEPSRYLRAISP